MCEKSASTTCVGLTRVVKPQLVVAIRDDVKGVTNVNDTYFPYSLSWKKCIHLMLKIQANVRYQTVIFDAL